jgi:hypothetical protein
VSISLQNEFADVPELVGGILNAGLTYDDDDDDDDDNDKTNLLLP